MLTLAEHVLKQDRKNCISGKQMESRQQTNEWKYKYLPHTKLKIKQNTKQQCIVDRQPAMPPAQPTSAGQAQVIYLLVK